jgi:hypothetical protein
VAPVAPVAPINTAAEIVNVFPVVEIVIFDPADIPTTPVKPFILLTPTTAPVEPLNDKTPWFIICIAVFEASLIRIPEPAVIPIAPVPPFKLRTPVF